MSCEKCEKCGADADCMLDGVNLCADCAEKQEEKEMQKAKEHRTLNIQRRKLKIEK